MDTTNIETLAMISKQHPKENQGMHETQEILYLKRHIPKNETQRFHHDALVLISCKQGHVHLDIKQQSYELYPNEMLMVPYMTLFQWYAQEDSEIHILHLTGRYVVQNISWFPYINEARLLESKHLNYLYQQIENLIDKTHRIDRDGFDAYLGALFYEIYQKLPDHEKEKTPTWQGFFPKSFTDILLYVHKHYTEPITLADLEKRFDITAQHIGRLFQRYVFMTYKTYVDKLRLEHALFYLRNTTMPIFKVAIEAGYPNNQSFVKAMKENTGYTPSAYRSK